MDLDVNGHKEQYFLKASLNTLRIRFSFMLMIQCTDN